jgi:hypothetical protein
MEISNMAEQGTQKTPENTGDPGRTPGSAEGDRETVEQDLKEKGLDRKGDSDASNKEKDQSDS